MEIILDTKAEDFYDVLNIIKETLKGEKFWLVGGYTQRWNGISNYCIQKVGDINSLLHAVGGLDDFILKITLKGKNKVIISGEGYHHDGANQYIFKTLEALTKQELIDLFDKKVNQNIHLGLKKQHIMDIVEELFLNN